MSPVISCAVNLRNDDITRFQIKKFSGKNIISNVKHKTFTNTKVYQKWRQLFEKQWNWKENLDFQFSQLSKSLQCNICYKCICKDINRNDVLKDCGGNEIFFTTLTGSNPIRFFIQEQPFVYTNRIKKRLDTNPIQSEK